MSAFENEGGPRVDRRRKKSPEERELRGIVKDFYGHGSDGSKMDGENAKAAILLAYIRELQGRREGTSHPMPDKDAADLGFDIDELSRGRIRPSPKKSHE